MPETGLAQRVAAVRRFNRFYTQRIGVLPEGHLESRFSLAEVRVLYELAHREGATASDLRRDLALDPGYLSRLLRGLGKRGLVETRPVRDDGRKRLLALTATGRKEFAGLDARANAAVRGLVGRLPAEGQHRLVGAMGAIESLLGHRGDAAKEPYLLRTHQPGDMGWVVHRHGVLYADEYGWDERFEALVAGIVARFIEGLDPARERCWIAERDGERVGSVFLVKRSKGVAQLRLLLVEPSARGLGIGARLVAECVRFARQAGYRKIVLWTNELLAAARHVYQGAGFRMLRKEREQSFGHDLVFETWELRLGP